MIPGYLVAELGVAIPPRPREAVSLPRLRRPKQQDVVDRLRSIVAGIGDFVRRGRGLVFYGSVGTGKDYLLSHAFYAAAAAGASPSRELESLLAFSQTGRIAEYVLRRLARPRGALPLRGDSRGRLAVALGCARPARARSRTLSRRPADAGDPQRHVAPGGRGILSAPVWSRLLHNAEPFECIWADYRTVTLDAERIPT